LCDAVAAVALLHVADDLVTPLLAEIDIEVRHRNAFRIEEALEQQSEPDRIEIGDGKRIGDERAGAGAAARATGIPCAFAHWMKSATMRK